MHFYEIAKICNYSLNRNRTYHVYLTDDYPVFMVFLGYTDPIFTSDSQSFVRESSLMGNDSVTSIRSGMQTRLT